MNFDAPPRSRRVKVLLFVLGGLALLFLGVIFGGYYLVMHTAVPLRMLGAVFMSGDNPENIKVEGISGSIAKGFKIKSIRWGTAIGASEVRDVCLAYNNFWDLVGGQRLVFQEIRIGRAHLDVTGSEQLLNELSDNSADDSSTNGARSTNSVVWTNSIGVARYPPSPRRPPGLFQIDRISVEDVFITNRANGFSLSVPTIEWKGFKALNGNVELGHLKIDSDRLKVTTLPGEEVDLQGKKKSFQKKLQGTVLPRLHPAILQPIAFTVDVGHDGTSLFWRLKAFDGKLEAYRLEDQSGLVKCQDLDLAAYINAPVPQHLSLEAPLSGSATIPKDGLRKGSFTLGRKAFAIEPLELEGPEDASKTNQLVAVCRSGDIVFTYRVIIPDQPWKVEQRLMATPAMTPEETLAQVFYEQRFAELTEEDQQSVKKMKASFGGWIPAEADKVR